MQACPTATDRCSQILDAAAKVFHQRGFMGARVAEIAEVAAISPGHLYNFFSCKGAIVAALIEREMRRYEASFERIASSADILEGIYDHFEAISRSDEGRRSALLRSEVAVAAAHDTQLAAFLKQSDERMRPVVMNLLCQGFARAGAPLSDADIEMRTDQLQMVFHGLSLLCLRQAPVDTDAPANPALRALLAPVLNLPPRRPSTWPTSPTPTVPADCVRRR